MLYLKATLITIKEKPKKFVFARILDPFIYILTGILKLIIPRANAKEFEDNISKIKYFYLELNMDNFPEREIGFNEKDEIVYLAPYGKNYGYLTDTDIPFEEKHFKTKSPITRKKFETQWSEAVRLYKSRIK